MMKVSSIRWGVIWIGIGLFFLAINLEVMDSLVFPRLFSLWPVLLIAIGVELIFRKTKLYFLALLSPILIAAAFVAAATYHTGIGWDFKEFFHGWSWSYRGELTSEAEIPFDPNVDTLRIELYCADADFDIRPGADMIFSAKSTYINRSPLIANHSDNRTIFVSFEYRDRPSLSFLNFGSSSLPSDFKITDKIPVIMTLNSKGKLPRIDLDKIRLVDLTLTLDSKEAMIRLGDLQDSIAVRIDGRTDRLDIAIPSDMGLEIVGDIKKLKSVIQGTEMIEFPDGFRTVGYSDSPRNVRLALDAHIKAFSLDRD